ncbi:MAG: DUF192 domain-containing protein [Bdellovibrionales bacterium]
MMAKLFNKTKNTVLVPQVVVAESLVDRLVGLLRHDKLENQGLWIKSNNSIHTYFMKFSIDVVFVDRELKVKAIRSNVKPWKVVWPVWGADSTFELPAGTLNSMNLSLGDHLDVS